MAGLGIIAGAIIVIIIIGGVGYYLFGASKTSNSLSTTIGVNITGTNSSGQLLSPSVNNLSTAGFPSAQKASIVGCVSNSQNYGCIPPVFYANGTLSFSFSYAAGFNPQITCASNTTSPQRFYLLSSIKHSDSVLLPCAGGQRSPGSQFVGHIWIVGTSTNQTPSQSNPYGTVQSAFTINVNATNPPNNPSLLINTTQSTCGSIDGPEFMCGSLSANGSKISFDVVQLSGRMFQNVSFGCTANSWATNGSKWSQIVYQPISTTNTTLASGVVKLAQSIPCEGFSNNFNNVNGTIWISYIYNSPGPLKEGPIAFTYK